jgi:hypothetical protein
MTTRTLCGGRAATPERWREAARRAIDEHIEVLRINGDGAWIATSGTRPGVCYELLVFGEIVQSCSCEAVRFGDQCCKHKAAFYLKSGALVMAEEEEEEAGTVPA